MSDEAPKIERGARGKLVYDKEAKMVRGTTMNFDATVAREVLRRATVSSDLISASEVIAEMREAALRTGFEQGRDAALETYIRLRPISRGRDIADAIRKLEWLPDDSKDRIAALRRGLRPKP